jgi:uracil-DNA glycosylase
MNPHLIPSLLGALSSHRPSSMVANPYASPALRNNLDAYLTALCSFPYSGHLLIGEAPGCHGCGISGIPFTSERVLRSGSHPFLAALFPSLKLRGNVTERAATIVWKQVSTRKSVPAFWNAFPFHPHAPHNPLENRCPTPAEIATGRHFLDLIIEILQPHTLVALGGVAASVLAPAFPHLQHVNLPHPSYKGTAGFIAGFEALQIP